MVAAGIPETRPDHAEVLAELALEMMAAVRAQTFDGHQLVLRIGINSGPVVAGVIGTRKFSYDLWGDTVNTASRIEQYGLSGEIQVGVTTREKIEHRFHLEEQEPIEMKGKGLVQVYLLKGRKHPSSPEKDLAQIEAGRRAAPPARVTPPVALLNTHFSASSGSWKIWNLLPLDNAAGHRILCAHSGQMKKSHMALTTIQDLRTHLQWAVQVELTTIPTYLYAMYSIKDQSSESANVFRSVVIEEMLHVALASNLLVAVGGQPKFYHQDIVPKYPGPMPHHREGFTVNLERASVDYVRDTCMAIELPEEPGAIPEDDNFDSIGQFYLALENCFRSLCEQPDHQVFAGNDTRRQLTKAYVPEISDTGDLSLVTDLDSAMSAMQTIIEQGEGIRGSHYDDASKRELAHYFKFERIAEGEALLGDVWPVVKNPKTADYPESLRDLSNLFNGCYCYMLLALEDIFTLTDATEKHRLVFRGLFSIMPSVMPQLARMIMLQPISQDEHAGPTFEYFNFEHGISKEAQLEELCRQAQKTNDGLDRIFSIITTLPDMTEL